MLFLKIFQQAIKVKKSMNIEIKFQFIIFILLFSISHSVLAEGGTLTPSEKLYLNDIQVNGNLSPEVETFSIPIPTASETIPQKEIAVKEGTPPIAELSGRSDKFFLSKNIFGKFSIGGGSTSYETDTTYKDCSYYVNPPNNTCIDSNTNTTVLDLGVYFKIPNFHSDFLAGFTYNRIFEKTVKQFSSGDTVTYEVSQKLLAASVLMMLAKHRVYIRGDVGLSLVDSESSHQQTGDTSLGYLVGFGTNLYLGNYIVPFLELDFASHNSNLAIYSGKINTISLNFGLVF